MKHVARSVTAIASVIAVGLISVFVASAGARTKAPARHDSGTAYANIVAKNSSTEYAAGYTFDKLFGQTATTYRLAFASGTSTGTLTVNAKRVTLYTPTGSLVGTGSAQENFSTGAITHGKLDLTRGTGGQRGHRFVGTFTGSLAKSGVITFNYKGTYR